MTTVKKYLHSRGEPGHGDAAPSDFSHSPALAHRVLTTGQKIRPAEQNTAQGPRLGGDFNHSPALAQMVFDHGQKIHAQQSAQPGTRPLGRDFSHSPALAQMVLTARSKILARIRRSLPVSTSAYRSGYKNVERSAKRIVQMAVSVHFRNERCESNQRFYQV